VTYEADVENCADVFLQRLSEFVRAGQTISEERNATRDILHAFQGLRRTSRFANMRAGPFGRLTLAFRPSPQVPTGKIGIGSDKLKRRGGSQRAVQAKLLQSKGWHITHTHPAGGHPQEYSQVPRDSSCLRSWGYQQ